MAKRKSKVRGLRKHRPYSVDEAARAMGMCRATIRRWIKGGLIAPIDGQRPTLLSGADLIDIAKPDTKTKRRCQVGEAFCFSCRAIRPMADARAEIVGRNASSVNLKAACATCGKPMFKRVSAKALPAICAQVDPADTQAGAHLIDTIHPCPNVHLGGADDGALNAPAMPTGEGVGKTLHDAPKRAVGRRKSIANAVYQPDLF